jgi:hypothetical protein
MPLAIFTAKYPILLSRNYRKINYLACTAQFRGVM